MTTPPGRRVGTMLREKDGDFNPGWLIACLVSIIGALGCLAVFVRVLRATNPASETVQLGLAFAFLTFVLVAWLTGVYSLGKAKVLNESKVLTQLAETFDVDERDEDQRASGH